MKAKNPKNKKSQNEKKEEAVEAQEPSKGSRMKYILSSMFKYGCICFFMFKLINFLYFNYILFLPPLELEVNQPLDKYVNIMKNQQSFNLTVYFIDSANYINERIWFEPNLTYAYSEQYPLVKTFSLPISKDVRNVVIMAELSTNNLYYGIHRRENNTKSKYKTIVDDQYLTYKSHVNLIKYERKFRIVQNSLLEADMGTEYSIEYSNDPKYYPHFKTSAYIVLVHDTHPYKEHEFVYRGMNDYKREEKEMYYSPLFYAHDIWTLRKDLVLLNESTSKVNLTLQFYLTSPGKHLYSRRLSGNTKFPDMLDELKDILANTNVYLLVTTIVVTILHTLLDILSFKNDFQFWLNNKSFSGISIKTLYVQIASDVIILLYLRNSSSQTSTYLFIFVAASILLNLWKLTRVCNFSFNTRFPFLHVSLQSDYTTSNTANYDTVAIKFMSTILLPCFFAYAAYSFLYDSYKSYYSFFISTLAGAVYTFGFILMTPQLYINYKLKSVGHLPWRALFYRFLRTIIDDLFSFVIKMPIMHRVACFRDDVIFVLYMVQRYMYKVDPKRSDEENA